MSPIELCILKQVFEWAEDGGIFGFYDEFRKDFLSTNFHERLLYFDSENTLRELLDSSRSLSPDLCAAIEKAWESAGHGCLNGRCSVKELGGCVLIFQLIFQAIVKRNREAFPCITILETSAGAGQCALITANSIEALDLENWLHTKIDDYGLRRATDTLHFWAELPTELTKVSCNRA